MSTLVRSLSITRVLAAYARRLRCEFTIDGRPEQAIFLLSPEILLPVVALHADGHARALMNRSLGVEFVEDDATLFGVRVDVPRLQGDQASSIRALFFAHAATAIFGLAHNVRVECRPVLRACEDLSSQLQQSGQFQWPLATVSPR